MQYQNIRGMNYFPSYAYLLNDVMDRYDGERIRRELGFAKEIGLNSVRMWFSCASYLRDSSAFLRNFEDLLQAVNALEMTLLPTLFNRWVDAEHPIGQLDLYEALGDFGPTKTEYVQAVVGAFRNDPRILLWDLCNEPFFYGGIHDPSPAFLREMTEKETRFWLQAIDAVRAAKPSQPLTMGFMIPSDPGLETVCQALDVLSFHPYQGWWNGTMAANMEKDIAFAESLGKPILCTETCQGSLDDRTRGQCVEKTLTEMSRHGVGWYAWVLMAGQMVSMRRDRTDQNAKPGDRGYMCFFDKEGKLRPYHDVILAFTK